MMKEYRSNASSKALFCFRRYPGFHLYIYFYDKPDENTCIWKFRS